MDIIGRDPNKPKRVRGRIGGETTQNERWFERREEVRDRKAARLLAAREYAREQIGFVFEDGVFA